MPSALDGRINIITIDSDQLLILLTNLFTIRKTTFLIAVAQLSHQKTINHQNQHIQLVDVARLRPGMFICDFNSGWLSHPFLLNQLQIETEQEIAEIRRHGIESVFIDSQRGLGVDEAPSLEEEINRTRHEMQDVVEHASLASRPLAPPSIQQDPSPLSLRADAIRRARQVLNQTTQHLRRAMADIRLGKPVNIPALSDSAEKISSAIIRDGNVMALLGRLRTRDEYTFAHSLNVSVLLARFSHFLGQDEERMHALALGGLLHDIGKTRVTTSVLNKPGKLNDHEYSHMKTHVALGAELLTRHDIPRAALEVLTEHHERFDGHGYPGNLHGMEISEAGRMAAIVDVYDAISSDRIYHRGLPMPEAMRRLYSWQRHFDPELIHAFIRCMGVYPVGSLVRLKSERLAIVMEHHPETPLRPKLRCIFDTRKKQALKHEDIDLTQAPWTTTEEILSHENPTQWHIDLSCHIAA